MWEIVKQVVKDYDPAKLFSIAVQKQVLMKECIRLNGGSVVKEPHIGVRQFGGLWRERRKPREFFFNILTD